jgi:hypothetical protein
MKSAGKSSHVGIETSTGSIIAIALILDGFCRA